MSNTAHQKNDNNLSDPRRELVMKTADLIANFKLSFSGRLKENAEEFLFQLESIKNCAGLTDAEFLLIAPLALKGRAATWFQIDRMSINTYDDFLKQFSLNFQKEESNNTMYYKVSNRIRGENEPIMSYLLDIQALMYKHSHLSEREQVKIAVQNLYLEEEDNMLYLRLLRANTMDDLKNALKDWTNYKESWKLRQYYQKSQQQ